MFAKIVLILLGVTTLLEASSWKPKTEYLYNFQGCSLIGLKFDDGLFGLLFQGKLLMQCNQNKSILVGKLLEAQYASVKYRDFQKLELSGSTFKILLRDSAIQDLIVEEALPNWEADFLKGILSQFQLNIKSNNSAGSPNIKDAFSYNVTEDTVTGKTETLYEFNALSNEQLQKEPWMAPLPQIIGTGSLIQISKTKNFNKSSIEPCYYYSERYPNSNRSCFKDSGRFLTRTSSSKIVLSGTIKRHILQSSVTSEDIFFKFPSNKKMQGLIENKLNVTIEDLRSTTEPLKEISLPKSLGSLVHSYYRLPEHQNSSPNFINLKLDQKFLNDEAFYRKFFRRFNVTEVVIRMSRQIGEAIEEPKGSSNRFQEALSKYLNLKSLIPSLTKDEINLITDGLYKRQTGESYFSMCSSDEPDGFFVFKRALAESGTEISLDFLDFWMREGIINKKEGIELIALASENVQIPNVNYMNKLHFLVKYANMQESGNRAVLAFTSLLNRVHNKGYYLPCNESRCVYDTIIEDAINYLNNNLVSAISNGKDNKRILTYIYAMGTMGHSKILESFLPYLDGKEQVSQFQRLRMMLALEATCNQHPELTRNAVFQVYNNTRNSREIRGAAVYLLTLSEPSKETLKILAENTKKDDDEKVKSVITSYINSIINLQSEKYEQLKKKAQFAHRFLQQKHYGIQFPKVVLKEYLEEDNSSSYDDILFTVGSDDSMHIKGLRYSLNHTFDEIEREIFDFDAGVSSRKNLGDVFQRIFEWFQSSLEQQKSNYDGDRTRLPSELITELLDIVKMEDEQVEGMVTFKSGKTGTIFTFDNDTISKIPNTLNSVISHFNDGLKCRNTKLSNTNQAYLTFAMATSFPFILDMNEPSFSNWKGKMQQNSSSPLTYGTTIQSPNETNIYVEAQISFSNMMKMEVGFFTPFDNQKYISGLDYNLEMMLPLNTTFKVDTVSNEVSLNVDLVDVNCNSSLLDYRQKYFINIYNTSDPEKYTSNVHWLKLPHKTILNETFGSDFGMELGVYYAGEPFEIDWLPRNLSKLTLDYIFQLAFSGAKLDIDELSIFPSEKQTQKIFDVVVGYQQKLQPECKIYGIEDEKIIGCEEVIYKAGLHFQDVGYDTSMRFLTSNYDELSAYRFQFNKTSKSNLGSLFAIDGFAMSKSQNVNELDINYALEASQSVDFYIQLQLTIDKETWSIFPHIALRRTKDRKQYLMQTPEMVNCQNQIQERDNQLLICARLMDDLNLLNSIDINLYLKENEVTAAKKVCSRVPSCLDHFCIDEKMLQSRNGSDVKHLKILINFRPDLKALNVTLASNIKFIKEFENLAVGDLLPTLFVMHPIYTINERIKAKQQAMQTFRPVCTIDSAETSTFDEFTYLTKLKSDWTLIFHYIPSIPRLLRFSQDTLTRQKEQLEQFSILVRQSTNHPNKKDVMLSIRSPYTSSKLFTILLETSSEDNDVDVINIYVDEKKFQGLSQNKTLEFHKQHVEVYLIPNNEIKVVVREFFFLVYDGSRVKLVLINDKFRGNTLGLCGNFNGEIKDEFLVPRGCVVGSAENFVDEYTISFFRTQNQKILNNSYECLRV